MTLDGGEYQAVFTEAALILVNCMAAYMIQSVCTQ